MLLLKASSMRKGRILVKGLRAKMLSSHGGACLSRRRRETLARKRSQLQNTNNACKSHVCLVRVAEAWKIVRTRLHRKINQGTQEVNHRHRKLSQGPQEFLVESCGHALKLWEEENRH